MATRQYRTLSKRIVDRLTVDDKDTVFGDRRLVTMAGFSTKDVERQLLKTPRRAGYVLL